MDFGLAGKKALVLGASAGLGAASARCLAAEGAQVWAVARSGEKLAQMKKSSDHSIARNLQTEVLDVTDRPAVDNLLKRLLAVDGVDILINNSGGPPYGAALEQTDHSWGAAFDLLAKSLFHITKQLLPPMLARGWGRVITIGSSGLEQPITNLALSNAVRGAVASWSKTLASEVAAQGVTVNMVLPGRIDTDRLAGSDHSKAEKTGQSIEEIRSASANTIPAGRYGQPEELGAVVTFLASHQAAYVTGSMIRVDGGLIRSI